MASNSNDVSAPQVKGPQATKVSRSVFSSSRLLSKLSKASLRSYRPPTIYRVSTKAANVTAEEAATTALNTLKSSDKENSPDQANLSPSILDISDVLSHSSSTSGSDQATPSPLSIPATLLHTLVDAISEEPLKKNQSVPVKLPSFSTLTSLDSTAVMATKSAGSSQPSPPPNAHSYSSMTTSPYASPRYVNSPYGMAPQHATYSTASSYAPSMYTYAPSPANAYSSSLDNKRPYYSLAGSSGNGVGGGASSSGAGAGAGGSPLAPSPSQPNYANAGDSSKRGRFGSNDGHSSPFGHGATTPSAGYTSTRWYNPAMPSYTGAGLHAGTTRHALPPLAMKSDSQPPFTGRYGHDDLAKAYDCYPQSSTGSTLETRRPIETKLVPHDHAVMPQGTPVRHAHDHVVPMATIKSSLAKLIPLAKKKHGEMEGSDHELANNGSASERDEEGGRQLRRGRPRRRQDSDDEGEDSDEEEEEGDEEDDGATNDSDDNEEGNVSSTQAIRQTLKTHLGSARKLEASNMAGATVNLPQIPFNQHYAQRKAHKLAERKRRREMKRLFDSLRGLLPAIGGSGVDAKMKLSKWEILNGAVDVIDALVRKQNMLLSKRSYLLPRLGLGNVVGATMSKVTPVTMPLLAPAFSSAIASSSSSGSATVASGSMPLSAQK